MFVNYKVNGSTFEIHDVYSEDGMNAVVILIEKLFDSSGCTRAEGYIDRTYKYFERSHELITRGNMYPYKVTEDYVYYEGYKYE